MLDAKGQRQAALFRRMTAIATALPVIPTASPRGQAIKREVSDWSHKEGHCTLPLPSDLVASLNSQRT
jgi:hypothetical protein